MPVLAFFTIILSLFFAESFAAAAPYEFAPPAGFVKIEERNDAAAWRDKQGRLITALHLAGIADPAWDTAKFKRALPQISKLRARLLSVAGITEYVTTSGALHPAGGKTNVVLTGFYRDINGERRGFVSYDFADRDGLWSVVWTEHEHPRFDVRQAETALVKFKSSGSSRNPASEMQLRPSLADPSCDDGRNDSTKSLGALASKIDEQMCSHVKPKLRKRSDADSYYSGFWGTTQWVLDTKAAPAFAIGCAQGIADVAIDFVKSMVDLVVSGVYLTIDPAYRAQVASSMSLLYASAKNDIGAFTKKILTALRDSLSQSASDWFNCMHPRAQFEQTCKLLTMLTPATMAMVVTFGPKAFAMMKAAKTAVGTLRAGVVTDASSASKLAELKIAQPKIPEPPAPLPLPAPAPALAPIPATAPAPASLATSALPESELASASRTKIISETKPISAQIKQEFENLGFGKESVDHNLKQFSTLVDAGGTETIQSMKTIVANGGSNDLKAVLESSGSTETLLRRVRALNREAKRSPKDDPALRVSGTRDPPHSPAEVETKTFLDLPRATEFPLPADFKAAVQSHKISKLREQYGDGENLAINLSYYTDSGVIHPGNFGESIQSQMVARTLREILPKAKIFRDDNPAAAAGKETIRLRIRDSAETNAVFKDGLEMPILKAANPGAASVSRNQLREKLGIPNGKFVATIYSKTRSSWTKLIEDIGKARKPDLVFLSAGGVSSDQILPSSVSAMKTMGYKIVKLSEYDSVDLTTGQKYAVINDLSGRMPHLYKASDLAVVKGPINFIEPLATGTRTIFMTDDASRGSYRLKEFSHLVETAKATGGGFPVSDPSALTNAVARAIQSTKPIDPPYLVKTSRSEPSSVVRYLDHLYDMIETENAAAKRPKPVRPPGLPPLVTGAPAH